MNCSIYLFGNFGRGITLYPNDYVKDIFKEFISRVSAPTQLIIHRDGAIMNYGYIRKLENNHLFGICIQVNGQSLTTINKLFEVFEDITTNVVVRGDIIQLNRQGNLISNIVELTDKSEEVERIVNYCQLELEKLSSDCQTLPPIDYSTTDNDVSRFRDSDNNQDIVNSSVKNGYTFIYKAHDYDSLALSGYRTILSSLNKENEANRRAIKELNSQLSKLKRQKKQLNVVVGLILTLFIASFIFFNTIEEKNKDIESKQKTINIQTSKNSELANENRDILSRQYELYDAYNQLDSSYKRLDNVSKLLNNKYDSLQGEYNFLVSEYISLQAIADSKQRKIEELNKRLRSSESYPNDYWRQQYNSLKSDYDYLKSTKSSESYSYWVQRYKRLLYDYDKLYEKYSSTSEGKRVLRRR